MRYDPHFAERAEKMGRSFIIAGENYGQGSSREHAAIGPMYLGVRCVIAKSIARIHRGNLINHGIVPMYFEDGADYDRLDLGDTLEIEDFRARIPQRKVPVKNVTKGFTFLKVKYRISNGKTVKTLVRSGIVRMRRKLKKLSRMVGKSKTTKDDVYASVQSWAAHARIARSYHAVRNMMKLYDELFGGYRITYRYWRIHKDIKRKRKVLRL